MNIQNSNINVNSLNSDYGFIACRAYNYRYETEKGGVIGTDGKNKNGQKIMNTVSPENFKVIGNKKKSQYDDSVRLAPDYAFYQENILTVSPDNPQEIYTGNFMFDKNLFGDETGGLPFPSEISDLFGKIFVEDSNGTESE